MRHMATHGRLAALFVLLASIFFVASSGVRADEAVGTEAPASAAAAESEDDNWQDHVDEWFEKNLVAPIASVLFYDFGSSKVPWIGVSLPFIVMWLLTGAIFFTIAMGFINLRGFVHAIRLTKGDYDDPEDEGEVSHFQALASALSATVGLGNIAGVAIAVGQGGPGAIFWMILAGLLGMSTKFTECTLGQMYRKVAPDGTVSGGPMHFLRDGLAELSIGGFRLGSIGLVLSIFFAVLCIGASFGGGCAFQVNQSRVALEYILQKEADEELRALQAQISDAKLSGMAEEELAELTARSDVLEESIGEFRYYFRPAYGLVMAFFVGLVIIGGFRRIAATASKIVPTMCGMYVAMALYVIFTNASQIDDAFVSIWNGAFTAEGITGGALGVLIIGIKRAAFSNEAGVGSASIAHAAARTDEPVSEGFVALLEPFIDTVVICTMTGLVIVITGEATDPENAQMVANDQGARLTAVAFESVQSWFPFVLGLAVLLFAFSTMISWSYYGERCWSHLFGDQSSIVYKLLFLVCVFLGAIITATTVLEFSDLMILSMALPNILGLYLLSGKVRFALRDYWRRYKLGEFDRS